MAAEQPADGTQVISQFEAAWARGESPQLDSFIPQDQADNVELVAELVAVDLERRLKADEAIRVELYLEQFPQIADVPGHVVDLLVAEFEYRRQLNPALAVDEYLERFPQYRDELLARLVAFDETLIDSDRLATRATTPTTTEDVDETVDGLQRRMVAVGLVTEQTVSNCRKSLPADERDNQHQIVDRLLREERVTAWQMKQLRAGHKTFVLENGRYILLDELGKGGMGAVYRARHVGLNRDVALKTIDPRQAKNKQLIGRFQREIAVCAKLQHEHIVQAYDMGCHENVHFLVLEYVQGADLASIVKRDGPLPPAEVAAIGLQGAAALVYAHSQGIVHRDIKPHNILLSTDGIAKLLDMGLASNHADDGQAEALTSLTQTGMVLGTADYMPPEQAADLAKVDGRSDIYSLGATLYYLLTGQPPFPGGGMMSKMHRLANEEPAPIGQLRPDCPRELTDVIERMLAKRPEERYQSAVEVVQALQPLAAERIAGRHVMTRAVHTAAEADTATPAAQTVAVTPFAVATADTVATSMLRPRKQSSLGKWLMAAAIGLPVLIGFGIWAAKSGDGARTGTDESAPLADTGSVSPDLNKPPSKIRIKPRAGHYSTGFAMAWSPDGRYFATARIDGDVRIWEPNELKTFTTYTGHHHIPIDVVFSPDGRTVASLDEGRELHLWNLVDGRLIYKVNQAVYGAIQFSPQGDEIAFRGRNGLVRWSVSGRRPIQLISAITYNRLSYSPSGHKLAGVANSELIDIWDLQRPDADRPKSRIPFHRITRPPLRYGDFVFVSETEFAVTRDGSVEIWNVESGEIVRKLTVPKITDGVGFARDGSKLLLNTEQGAARVDVASGKVERFDKSFGFRWSGSTNFVAPGGSRYVRTDTGSGSGQRIWLNDLGAKTIRQLPGTELIGIGYFTPVGKRYLHINSTERDEICEFDLATGRPIRKLNIFGQPYVTNDGRFLVVVESGSTRHVEALPMHGSVAEHEVYPAFEESADFRGHQLEHIQGWSHGGDQYWRTSYDLDRVRFWDVRTGKVGQTMSSINKDNLLYVMPGSRLFVWRQSVEGQPGGRFLLKPMTGEPTAKTVSISLAGNPSLSLVDLSADDRRILFKPYLNPRLYLFDSADGRQMKELLIPEDLSPKFGSSNNPSTELSPNGRYLLLYDRIYHLNESAKSPVWQMAEHTHVFYRAALLGDERHVVMRLGDRIEVWDWRNDNKRLTIFLLPQKQWFLYNHETSHWNSSNFAFRFVECLYRDADGKEEWVVPFVYEQRTGWENVAAKAGLADLQRD